MIGSTQYMIDRNAMIGQRGARRTGKPKGVGTGKSTAIEDWHTAKCCFAFDDQTVARREDCRQIGEEYARQRVPGAERNRQVLARGDEVRELDWRLYSDPRRSSPSRHLLTKDQFRFAAESVVPLPLSSSGATRARTRRRSSWRDRAVRDCGNSNMSPKKLRAERKGNET